MLEYWKSLTAWWVSLPLVLQALIVITACTFSMVEMFKRIASPYLSKRNRRSTLTLVALLVGIIVAMTGYFVASGKLPLWSWLFLGAVNGYLTTILHRAVMMLIAWKFPQLAEKLRG